MPRQQKRGAAATIPARGKKTTFEGADDVEEHQPIASSSRISTPSVELEEADSDDDAPEAVSVTHTKGQGIRPDETYASRQEEAKNRAAAERSRRIAQLKKGSKNDQPEDGDDDAEEEGSEDSDEELAEELDDEDEDVSDADTDDTETLEEGPLDEETIRLRARMDAAMAAADRRAASTPTSESSEDEDEPTEEDDGDAALTAGKAGGAPVVAEERQWDLSRVQPLSAAALEKAQQTRERKQAEQAAALEAKRAAGLDRKKRKRRTTQREETTRTVGNTTFQLLEPTLSVGDGGLPPVQAVKKQKTAKDARAGFLKRAMKQSGAIPGRGLADGRRPAPSFTVR